MIVYSMSNKCRKMNDVFPFLVEASAKTIRLKRNEKMNGHIHGFSAALSIASRMFAFAQTDCLLTHTLSFHSHSLSLSTFPVHIWARGPVHSTCTFICSTF